MPQALPAVAAWVAGSVATVGTIAYTAVYLATYVSSKPLLNRALKALK